MQACCQLIVNLPATKKPEGPLPGKVQKIVFDYLIEILIIWSFVRSENRVFYIGWKTRFKTPLTVIDIICLIDGSDSFNIKVDAGNTSRTDKNNANSFPGNS